MEEPTIVRGGYHINDGGMERELTIRFEESISPEARDLIYYFIDNAFKRKATFSYVLATLPIAYSKYNLKMVIDLSSDTIVLDFIAKK